MQLLFKKPTKLNADASEHDMVNNPNWPEADQLVIYQHDRGVELGFTKKQL